MHGLYETRIQDDQILENRGILSPIYYYTYFQSYRLDRFIPTQFSQELIAMASSH